MDELLRVIKDSKDLIAAEPTLLEIQVPCIVVGDIHGQVNPDDHGGIRYG